MVNAKYTAIAYTVTFKADGKTVDTQTYTIEDKNITEPKVPEKEGYTGKWKDYNLNGGDRTVIAVYERRAEQTPSIRTRRIRRLRQLRLNRRRKAVAGVLWAE